MQGEVGADMPRTDGAEEAVLTALRERRSVARVDPEGAVTREAIERALELAVLAPNHRLTEPWRFTVVAGDARRRVGEALAAESVANGRLDPARAPLEAAKWLRAPVVIVVSSTPAGDEVMRQEDRLAIGAAVENLLLALHVQGLGAMWRTGASARSAAVRAALGLSPEDEMLAFVYVGPPADGPLPPRRRRLSGAECTRWLSE